MGWKAVVSSDKMQSYGVLDEQEAGERLFRHLFPHWG